jgi:hypothetical protein
MLTLFVLAFAAVPQEKIALTKPDAEYAEPFTSIRGVREVANGKVLVTDSQDKVVQLLDLASGSAIKVGREGQGPEEYMLPMGLFGMPDGSTVLQDLGNRRFLTIQADGKIGKSFSPPTPSAQTSQANGPGAFVMGAGLMNVRGSDARGNLYFQGMGIPTDGSSAAADSVPLMTWDRVSPKVDTVAWLPIPANQRPQVSRDGNRQKKWVPTTTCIGWKRGPTWMIPLRKFKPVITAAPHARRATPCSGRAKPMNSPTTHHTRLET